MTPFAPLLTQAPTPARQPWRQVAIPVLALLFLNGMLSFSTWWPTPAVVPDHRLAPEFVWLWLALLAVGAWRNRPPSWVLSLLTAVYALLVLGRYADITVPSLFGREISLYWDGAQIPRFLWVSAQDHAWWQSAGVLVALLFGAWALLRLLRLSIRVTLRDAVPYALNTRWVWGLSGAATVLVIANLAGVRATWPVVSKPVIPTYWRQAKLLATAFSPGSLARRLPAATTVDAAMALPPGQALGALNGRDVYLVFVESLGAVVYDNPKAAQALRGNRQQLAADIAASGRHVVSAFVSSPTFAGGSDLAHMGLLSGIDLREPMRHELLLTTQRPTLLSLFRSQGYQTFGLYPAVDWPWPERAFYGFDVYLERGDLGYRGPELGHWKVPDQFAMARFEQLHPRGPGAPPRLLFFPTITSHMPFNPVPPYQPDWQRVLTADPFEPADTQRAQASPNNWLDMFPGYVGMIDYNYRWLAGWLRQPEPRETIYLLIGDHQPAANITGEGASWDVPVHIVSSDRALLGRFEAMGFHAGLEPPRSPLGAMHDLTGLLLRGFSSPSPSPALADAGSKVLR